MYEKTIKLNHNEVAAKVNRETGEVTAVPNRPNNIPQGKKLMKGDNFYKGSVEADALLITLLDPLEYRVVGIMRSRAKMNTNSLEPLNDETSLKELAEHLLVSRNRINTVITKLRNLGVFATFEVVNHGHIQKKVWILNPSISFKGRIISEEIIHLFSETSITKLLRK